MHMVCNECRRMDFGGLPFNLSPLRLGRKCGSCHRGKYVRLGTIFGTSSALSTIIQRLKAAKAVFNIHDFTP